MILTKKIGTVGLISAAIVVVCLGIGIYVGRAHHVTETAAQEVTQEDGSKVLARADTQPDAKPAHQLPKGSTLERIEKLTITPNAAPVAGKCPPVSVDLSLVRMPDHTRRVVASSPDGEVAGIDIPVDTPDLPEEHPWAAGLSYDPIKQTPGIWLERDIGHARLGVEVAQTRIQIGGTAGVETRIRMGWSF